MDVRTVILIGAAVAVLLVAGAVALAVAARRARVREIRSIERSMSVVRPRPVEASEEPATDLASTTPSPDAPAPAKAATVPATGSTEPAGAAPESLVSVDDLIRRHDTPLPVREVPPGRSVEELFDKPPDARAESVPQTPQEPTRDYRMIAPIELDFRDDGPRVGVRPGTDTYAKYERLAGALLADLERFRRQ